MNQTISVLIACFNGEKYIKRCLESVIEQTYKVNEIIIVNDGSTDNSLKILENYKKENKNIKIINQENKGLSKTRNILIKNSTSEYFYFLDIDDWLELDCFENFNKILNNENYDLIFSKSFINEKNVNPCLALMNKNTSKEWYAINNATFIWNILISSNFWKNKNLSFYDEYPLFEDIGTFTYMVSKANKVSYVLKPTYHYLIAKKSNSRNLSEDGVESLFKQIEYLFKILNKEFNKKYPRYVNDNIALSISVLMHHVFKLPKQKRKEYKVKIKKIVNENGGIKFPISIWKFFVFFLYKFGIHFI